MDQVFKDKDLVNLILEAIECSVDAFNFVCSFKLARSICKEDYAMDLVCDSAMDGPYEYLERKSASLDAEFWQRYFKQDREPSYCLLEYGLRNGDITAKILKMLFDEGLIRGEEEGYVHLKNGEKVQICICFLTSEPNEMMDVLSKNKVVPCHDCCGHNTEEKKIVSKILYGYYVAKSKEGVFL